MFVEDNTRHQVLLNFLVAIETLFLCVSASECCLASHSSWSSFEKVSYVFLY